MSRSQLWNIALITARSGEHQLAVKLLLRFIEAPHEVGGDPVEIKGDPHLQVAKVILADGLQSPWPATLATLASRERWEPKYVTDLIEALTDHVVNAGDPFRVGAKVLMQVGHGAERSSTLPISWETATVKRTRTSNRSTFDLVNWKTHMDIDASKVRVALAACFLSSAAPLPRARCSLFFLECSGRALNFRHILRRFISSQSLLASSLLHLSSSLHLLTSGDCTVEQRPQLRNARSREDRRFKHRQMHAQSQGRHLQLRRAGQHGADRRVRVRPRKRLQAADGRAYGWT